PRSFEKGSRDEASREKVARLRGRPREPDEDDHRHDAENETRELPPSPSIEEPRKREEDVPDEPRRKSHRRGAGDAGVSPARDRHRSGGEPVAPAPHVGPKPREASHERDDLGRGSERIATRIVEARERDEEEPHAEHRHDRRAPTLRRKKRTNEDRRCEDEHDGGRSHEMTPRPANARIG